MSSQAATRREITNMQAEAQGQNSSRILDIAKENSLRSQGTNQQFGMLKYEAIPGGSQIAGTTLPIRKGFGFYDFNRGEHILQKSTNSMNNTTTDTTGLQNENTNYITQQKIDASTNYQDSINQALENQASQTVGAISTGTNIAASSAKQGAGINIGGINQSTVLEKQSNGLNFEGRIEAAAINQKAASEAAHLRMMSSVVSGFFRDMDRRLEEMKPKY